LLGVKNGPTVGKRSNIVQSVVADIELQNPWTI
jgi:hypothetical protein